ncbi:MAG TPA: hypothetical protein PK659_09975 [Methanothrix sp.]|nr:hypothetical protein [Methanothrix sp.]HOL44568.1 hypothetical protein [Methanothrix sp.]
MEIYRLLENREKIRSTRQKDDDAETRHNVTELTLYRLQQLGLIDGYTMSYEGSLKNVVFEAEYNQNWTAAEVIGNLKNFLIRYNASMDYINEVVSRLQDTPVSSQDSDVRGEHFVSEAVKILLEHIYNTIPKMRYQMLENERLYAKSQKCRRIILRSIFDNVERAISDNYRCEFCDVCEPTLRFPHNRAEVPLYEIELDEIARQLPKMLESFDINKLRSAAKKIIDKQAVTGIFAQVTFYLEQRYNNPAALYLAGVLSKHRNERAEALRYLRDGFELANQWRLKLDSIKQFYLEAATLDANEAFSWLLHADSFLRSSEGCEFLLEEAFRIFGEESLEYQNLTALWMLQKYNKSIKIHEDILQRVNRFKTLKVRLCQVQMT